jgi:ATP:ADP antiporter, AAA family
MQALSVINQRLQSLFMLRTGEVRLVLLLGSILLLNSIAQQFSEITAVSNFLAAAGVNNILLMWVLEGIFIILVAGSQSLFVDRFNRIMLMRWFAGGLAVIFALLRIMFWWQAPDSFTYGFLFLIAEFQWLVLPLIFWLLASDILEVAQSNRLFPLIASFNFVGKLIGIGIAFFLPGWLVEQQLPLENALFVNIALYIVIYLLLVVGLRKARIRQTVQTVETMRESLSEGWEFVREVKSFRYLAVVVCTAIICETFVEFRFLDVTNAYFAHDPARYQSFYSLYQLVRTLVSIILLALVVKPIISRIRLKNSFMILPVCNLISLSWLLAIPTNIGSTLAATLVQKVPQYTVDDSARKSFEAMVPEERRGRVSLFLDSYLYGISAIFGCMILGVVILVSHILERSNYFYGYLGSGIVASLVGFWAAYQLSREYDSSLLNWRLRRRQKGKSILDKLEF